MLHLCEDLLGSVLGIFTSCSGTLLSKEQASRGYQSHSHNSHLPNKKSKWQWFSFLSKNRCLLLNMLLFLLYFSQQKSYFCHIYCNTLNGPENVSLASFLEHLIVKPSSPLPLNTTTKTSFLYPSRKEGTPNSWTETLITQQLWNLSLHKFNPINCAAH